MSYLIPHGSTKTDRAIRFGKELDRAMKARNVGRRPVAQALGASDTSVMYWRTGRMLPRTETARKLAEALDWPRLLTLLTELRTKRCLVDDVEFVDESGSDNRVYCSPGCQRLAEKKRMGSTIDKRAAVAERRLALHQRAVAAFCAECEPEGLCRAPECALRDVSPLPLFEHRTEVPAVVGGRKPLSEEDLAERSRLNAAAWARYTPEERAARIAKTAEASKRARGLIAL